MDHTERWADWALIVSGAHTYLGEIRVHDELHVVLYPCVEVRQQFPIVQGEDGRPVMLPVYSLTCIDMTGTDKVQISVRKVEAKVLLKQFDNDVLEQYSVAYDQMLAQLAGNRRARSLKKSAIMVPNQSDTSRFGKGGMG